MPRVHLSALTAILRQPQWTADDARVVLDALDAAGTTLAGFARSHGVDPQRLYAWRRRLHRAPTRARPLHFVELSPTGAPPSTARYEIVLPSGAQLCIEGPIVVRDVTTLLALLRDEIAPC